MQMTSEELRRLVGVEPITSVIRSGRLRWYEACDEENDGRMGKKCLEIRVEGRRKTKQDMAVW